jgi:hypothetical protein
VPNPAAVTTYDDYIPVGERFLPIHIKVRKRALVSLLGCVLTDQELHLIPLTSDFSRLEHVDTPILTKLPNRSLFTRCSVFTSIIGSNYYAESLHFLNVREGYRPLRHLLELCKPRIPLVIIPLFVTLLLSLLLLF